MYLLRVFLSIVFFLNVATVEGWTSTLHIEPKKSGSTNNTTWNYEKIGLKKFNQLIFSWNALRPQGYYTFTIRVRDSVTKKWYPWHKAAQWGTKIQRSFSDGSRASTDYNFVRLELPKYRYADGFSISIIGHRALIKNIDRVSINTANLDDFKNESPYRIKDISSILINRVPRISQMAIKHQANASLCSPTSITMLTSYLTGKCIDPKQVAQRVYDTGLEVYGSWPFNTAHAYELTRGRYFFHIERLANFKQLYTHLRQGIPVIVSVTGYLRGAPITYKNGHLLVVVGYDAKRKKVWCNDPAFKDKNKTLVAYELNSFLKAWERSKRLAYIASKKGP